jgi:hyperosmotically inducible protein
MSKPSRCYHPSLETSAVTGEPARTRPSLYHTKDAFIERISPVATAVIFFGTFSLAPQDTSLSHQALFKLSFLHRHFLQHGGLKIVVNRQTAVLSGTLTSRLVFTMAEILAGQIEGIRQVKDETEKTAAPSDKEAALEAIQFLFATDQTLRTGIQASLCDGRLTLEGEITSPTQKLWAEQLAGATGHEIDSNLTPATFIPAPMLKVSEPPQLDDESLQALVLFRLRLVCETESLPVKVKASRGVVTLQGKVRTEALRQRAENIARSTLGIRELRSSLTIAA